MCVSGPLTTCFEAASNHGESLPTATGLCVYVLRVNEVELAQEFPGMSQPLIKIALYRLAKIITLHSARDGCYARVVKGADSKSAVVRRSGSNPDGSVHIFGFMCSSRRSCELQVVENPGLHQSRVDCALKMMDLS